MDLPPSGGDGGRGGRTGLRPIRTQEHGLGCTVSPRPRLSTLYPEALLPHLEYLFTPLALKNTLVLREPCFARVQKPSQTFIHCTFLREARDRSMNELPPLPGAKATPPSPHSPWLPPSPSFYLSQPKYSGSSRFHPHVTSGGSLPSTAARREPQYLRSEHWATCL